MSKISTAIVDAKLENLSKLISSDPGNVLSPALERATNVLAILFYAALSLPLLGLLMFRKPWIAGCTLVLYIPLLALCIDQWKRAIGGEHHLFWVISTIWVSIVMIVCLAFLVTFKDEK